jgi:glutamate racemase
MNNSAIGVFDSGLGGLTVVGQLFKFLPNENIVYFGDTGRVPYGTRSNKAIECYARQDISFLLSKDVKLIIAACGTVSSVAPHIADDIDIPFIEVVTPAAKAAVSASHSGRIGVIGTAATVSSGAYKRCIQQLDPGAQVFQNACSLFVPLVESGWFLPDDDVVRLTAERYLSPLIENQIDTLILGCTHYPILAPVIQRVVGDSVTLINTGETTAARAAEYLTEHGLLAEENTASHHFFVSDTADSFEQTAGILLGRDMPFDVKRVDIEQY